MRLRDYIRWAPAMMQQASGAFFTGDGAHGFPSTKAYRHARTRQKMARASRRANRP